MNYDTTTGEYVPLENNAPENNCNSSSTESESEPEGENDPDSSPESTVSKSSCKKEDSKEPSVDETKEPRVLSDGEISSPSPPPPPAKEKKKKRKRKDYDNFYYLDDEKSRKKLKKEKNIPCIRLVVHKSDSIEPGKLFIATCKGATIGREVCIIKNQKVSSFNF